MCVSLPAEEGGDRHQPGRGRVPPGGGGQLLGEAVRSAAARVRPDLQQPLDVLPPAPTGLQTAHGLRERSQAGGKPQDTRHSALGPRSGDYIGIDNCLPVFWRVL